MRQLSAACESDQVKMLIASHSRKFEALGNKFAVISLGAFLVCYIACDNVVLKIHRCVFKMLRQQILEFFWRKLFNMKNISLRKNQVIGSGNDCQAVFF